MNKKLSCSSICRTSFHANETKGCLIKSFFAIAFGFLVIIILKSNHFQWQTPYVTLLLSKNVLKDAETSKFFRQPHYGTLSKSDYYFARYKLDSGLISRRHSSAFTYSEDIFRSASSQPILWVDNHGDVRWNEAAEREMYFYLLNKQTIEENKSEDQIVDDCLRRRFFIIQQHVSGFFSRFHCFIEQFGQTLYSPWMTLLSINKFSVSRADRDDFLGEGILRYFEPISTCSKYSKHPRMRYINSHIRKNNSNSSHVTAIQQLLYSNQLKITQFSILGVEHAWSFGYEHVPIRRWMFNHNPISRTYNLSVEILINHTNEHIYRAPSLTDGFLARWTPRNRPWGWPRYHLAGDQYKLTWQDHAFMAFLRYLFVLYFHRLAPRIHQMTHLLAEHWSNYLMDKEQRSLNDTAALYIRRGDKMSQDSFWHKHKRWRNISMYVKGLVDEERRQNRTFSSIFIMTDDLLVMESIQSYADPNSKGSNEPYARKHLRNRRILYNIFAPQACFDPFIRAGFDQFLVSLEFIVRYVQFTVGHSDSNVGSYLQEITYGRNQLRASVRSDSFVINAPDSL